MLGMKNDGYGLKTRATNLRYLLLRHNFLKRYLHDLSPRDIKREKSYRLLKKFLTGGLEICQKVKDMDQCQGAKKQGIN